MDECKPFHPGAAPLTNACMAALSVAAALVEAGSESTQELRAGFAAVLTRIAAKIAVGPRWLPSNSRHEGSKCVCVDD